MRKLKIIEHISLDGVIQHSADDGDFPYSDWNAPYRTPAGRDAVTAAHGERFDLLLGRRTYDAWSGFWPKAPSSPMAVRHRTARRLWPEARPGIVGATPKQQIEAFAMRGEHCVPASGGPIGRGPVAVGEAVF